MGGYDNDGQYERHSIVRYERVFGDGYVSSGGHDATVWLFDQLSLPERPRILDIGSGLGGFAFHVVDSTGGTVLGVDYAELMVTLANERVGERAGIAFKHGDIRTLDVEDGAFDCIWSRDSFLHIPEKAAVFARMRPWLRKGGQVLITDYARSSGAVSAEFSAYANAGGYDLLGVEAYGELFSAAGYSDVRAVDWTDRFVAGMQAEKAALLRNRASFTDAFSEADLDYLVARWDDKIRWCGDGDMKAGLWMARA